MNLTGNSQVKDDAENARFAWRQLEVSNRLQDQTCQFLLFCPVGVFYSGVPDGVFSELSQVMAYTSFG